MKLTNTQLKAVSELIEHFEKAYNNSHFKNNPNIIEFNAPTGSGKTFMIANFIDKAISLNKQRDNKPIIFIVMTLSNAELPKQMEYNFNDYKFYLENKQDIIFERKESPSSSKNNVKDVDYTFKVESNKVFILGASSFGQRKIYTKEGILDKFISEISNNYFVVFIRDEAHIGTKESELNSKEKTNAENFYNQMLKIADFQINMTATPKGNYTQVKIHEEDLNKDNIQLIKTTCYLNDGLSEINSEIISDLDLLDVACKQFKKIKQKYITEEGLIDNINPAMLIQVWNENDSKQNKKEKIDKEKIDLVFNENIKKIIHKLEEYNLTWAKYFSSDKIDINLRGNLSLRAISKNNSDIDVIIFKIGPATGWNIPRACMLVQLRDVSSKNLSIQTIGRIKRNPNPNFKFKDDSYAFKYWIYSNKAKINEIFKDSNINTYKLNKDSTNDKFYYGEINKDINEIEITDSKKIIEIISKNNHKLLNEYNYYLEYYKEYGFLPIKNETITESETNITYQYINQKINNIIELTKYVKELEQKVLNILNKKIIRDINNYFIEKYDNKIIPLLWYAFFNSIYQEVKKCILQLRKIIIKETNKKEYELIYSKKMPENVIVSYSLYNKKNNVKFVENEINYKYELITTENKGHKHFFNSQNEICFIQKIKKLFNKHSKNNNYDSVCLFRNPVSNGIFYEYYDDANNIKRQFPDFILVYKTDKIEHQINIEIKDSNNDYNGGKTIQIINSYNGYFSENKAENQIVSSILLKVDKIGNNINVFVISGGGSTNSIINEEIKNNISIKKDIKWIYDLAKNI